MNNKMTQGVDGKSQGLLWSADGSCLQQINVHNGHAVDPLHQDSPEGYSLALTVTKLRQAQGRTKLSRPARDSGGSSWEGGGVEEETCCTFGAEERERDSAS